MSNIGKYTYVRIHYPTRDPQEGYKPVDRESELLP